MVVIGFDPGGRKAFGWAVYRGSYARPVRMAAGVSSAAPEAVQEVARVLNAGGIPAPDAVGIDAPMFWSPAGDRGADLYVRQSVCRAGGAGGTVGHVNSLRGACVVQGAVAAKKATDLWPRDRLTETHPKALMIVSDRAARFGRDPELSGDGHHLRDAALSALGCFAMLEAKRGWRDLTPLDPDFIRPLGVAAEYWFPIAERR